MSQCIDFHVFCCINERSQNHPRGSCCQRGAKSLLEGLKERLKLQNFSLSYRIQSTSCFNCCEKGPVVVIYPTGEWIYEATEEAVLKRLKTLVSNN